LEENEDPEFDQNPYQTVVMAGTPLKQKEEKTSASRNTEAR
jgi:hypothetical protein